MKQKLTELGLGKKLSLYIIFAAVIIFAIIFINNMQSTENILTENAELYSRQLLDSQSKKLVSILDAVETVPQVILDAVANNNLQLNELIATLPTIVLNNQYIIGAGIGFSPQVKLKDLQDIAPYFYEDNGKINKTSLQIPGYPYTNQDWYLQTEVNKKAIWNEPRVSKNTNDLMTSYSAPIYRNNNFIGVIKIDVSLTWLSKVMQYIDFNYEGYGFIISSNGKILAHPNKNILLQDISKGENNYFQTLQEMTQAKKFTPKLILKDPIIQDSGRVWMHKLPKQNWYLGIVISEKAMTRPMTKLKIQFWNWAIIGLIVCILVIRFLTSSLLRPLQELSITAQHLGQGEFDYPIPDILSKDEIGELCIAFSRMQHDIKNYISETTRIEAAKKAMEQELEIAQKIQLSMVPQEFEQVINQNKIDIYAKLIPAKGVGGDLYDIFWLDENTLFFTLGDVSGKGIPAALFMTKTIITIRSLAPELLNPAEILSHTNEDMCQNNNNFMFVTLVCGTIDIKTGKIILANAGHLPPLLISDNFATEYQPLPPQSVLAINSKAQYENTILVLSPKDKIVLYSDGITEALAADNTMYGEKRLLELAKTCSNLNAKKTTDNIIDNVKQFVNCQNQSDDMAVLVIEWIGDNSQ